MAYDKLEQGYIREVHYNTRTYDVQISDGRLLKSCQNISGIFSALLGYNFNFITPVNTKVLVLAGKGGDASFFFTLPSTPLDVYNSGTRSVTGSDKTPENYKLFQESAETSGKTNTATMPTDLLEGEFEIANKQEIALQMLTYICKLSAGDKAVIEASLINDMVRLVSTNFKNHTAFGDYEIQNDGGRVNVRFEGSSYPNEVLIDPGDEDTQKKALDGLIEYEDEDLTKTGKARFSEYIGYLGDFFNRIISDPEVAISDHLRAGKSRFHMGSDGTLLMQSVSEIALERVCRIPVPKVVREYHVDASTLNKEYLKIWKYGDTKESMSKTCYMLRQYARYLSQYQTYARIRQLEDEDPELASIPSEDEIKPEWNNKEDDRQGITTPDEILNTYATIRIMRDGSIVNWDGYGNAVVMSYQGTQISSTGDLQLEAAGDIVMNAGKNIRMQARKSIDIVASLGGIIMKSKSWFRALCEKGTLWLKSDKMENSAAEGEEETPQSIDNYGVLIESTSGETLIQGGQSGNGTAGGGALKLGNATSATVLSSGQSRLDLKTANFLTMQSNRGVKALTQGGFVVKAADIEMGHSKTSFTIPGSLAVRPGGRVSIAEMLSVKRLMSQTASVENTIEVTTYGGQKHEGHVYTSSYQDLGGRTENYTDLESEISTAPYQTFENQHPVWSFDLISNYLNGVPVYQTLSQQYLEQEAGVTDSFAPESLTGKYNDTNSLPWPGKGAKMQKFSDGESLWAPLTSAPLLENSGQLSQPDYRILYLT